MVFSNNLLLGAVSAAAGDYLIEQSLLFNGTNQYLSRTPSTAGNRKTWTFSCWVKLAGIGDYMRLFCATPSSGDSHIIIRNTGEFHVTDGDASGGNRASAALLRDPNAWYHLVTVFDTTNATADDRLRMYINGVRVTEFSSTYGPTNPTLNADTWYNAAVEHRISSDPRNNNQFFDGLMALPILVDGAALDPTSFGELDDDGYWNPIEFTGAASTEDYLLNGITPIASGEDAGYPKANAFDGSVATASEWRSSDFGASNNGVAYIGFDAGAGNTVQPDTLCIMQGRKDVTGNGAVSSMLVQYSDDNSTWTTQSTEALDNSAANADNFEKITLTSAPAKRYWRCLANSTTTGSGQRWAVTELQMFAASASAGFGTNGFVLDFSDTSNFGANTAKSLPTYQPYYVTFDGVNDYLTRGASYTGAADADNGIISFWYRPDATPSGTADTILHAVGGRVTINHSTSGAITIDLESTVGAKCLDLDSSAITAGQWNHILASWDLSATTAHLYVNDVLDEATNTPVNATVDYTATNWTIGAFNASTSQAIAGGLAEFYFAPGQYLDFDTESNRRLFIDADGFPVNLGADGSTPTSTAPAFFHSIESGDTASAFATNAGSGGGMTENGALVLGSNVRPLDYTANNFTAADQLSDTPTDSAADEIGNYAVIDPNGKFESTLSEGNLKVTGTSVTGYTNVGFGTLFAGSGKYYWECEWVSGIAFSYIGAAEKGDPSVVSCKSLFLSSAYIGRAAAPDSWAFYADTGQKSYRGTGSAYGSAASATDILAVALDMDNGKIWVSVNGVWQNSGDPAAGTGEMFSGLAGEVGPAHGLNEYAVVKYNFGQTAFTYTPPTGFSALATQNLPAPTIADPSAHFKTLLYTGNFSTQSITGFTDAAGNNITPDLLIIKDRDNATYGHVVADVNRGVAQNLFTNTTDAEDTATRTTSFDSGGFSVGASLVTNRAGSNIVAHCFKAGGAPVSNTDGSITSSVSANPTAGFSIVSYTGTGSAATIGHGLSVVPKWIIIKRRDSTGTWVVYDSDNGATGYSQLNASTAWGTDSGAFNNTSPTSSVFSVGNSAQTNANTGTYVAYCFAEVDGFSAFGSYTGNGSADGPMLPFNFLPQFFMFKRTDGGGAWYMTDAARSPYNVGNEILAADVTNAENSGFGTVSNFKYDYTSNGFKFRGTNASDWNGSGAEFIYMAFGGIPIQGDDGYTQARAR
jgi:hypothetical protein